MRISLLIIAILFALPIPILAQEEHDLHLASIRASRYKKVSPQGIQGDSAFIEYAIEYLLEAPQDVMFISNRELLEAFCVNLCREDSLHIHDTLRRNKMIDVYVMTRPFEADSHQISFYPGEDSLVKAIDGRKIFGAVDDLPTVQIDSIGMKIGNRDVYIPPEAYRDLFQPNLCEGGYFRRPLMVYPSRNGEYYYMYLYGGRSSGTYLAKLIFDKKNYIKKIVAEYEDLIQYDCIRPGFLGF